MKTKFLAFAVLILISISASAQLKNTKWKGIVNIPAPTEVELEFRNHTINLLYEGEVIEYMWYEEKDNNVIIYKYWGGSPCKSGHEDKGGEYKINNKGNTMKWELIKEDCPIRAESLKASTFTKVK